MTKYDSAGSVLWSQQISTTLTEYGMALAASNSGDVYLGGYTYGALGAPNAGGADAFLVKLDSPTAPIPLPAALPASLAMLGGLGMVRRREMRR